MKPTLLALSYFQKAAEKQHLTKVAEELHISQPSLSRTIKTLETDLGAPLFERSGRNIVLTRYGEILLRHTEKIMEELRAAEKEIEDMKGAQQPTVSFSLFAASKLIPGFLMEFRRLHPNIHLEILQQKIDHEKKKGDGVDLSLFSSINPMENDYCTTLMEEEILLAMPDTDPHAGDAAVKLKDFAESGFILLQTGKSLRAITDVYCHAAGFTPRISLESDSPDTVREFIRAGLGISFVPKITWHGVSSSHVKLVPISTPICRRSIILSWRADIEDSPSAVLLRNYMIDNFARYAYGQAEK